MGDDGGVNLQGTFNQAGFQQIRIHQIMSQVNLCWLNLTGETEGIPNHQILFDCLCAYYLEVRPSFTDTQQKEVDAKLIILEKIITNHPLWRIETLHSLSGNTSAKTLNISLYYLLRKEFRDFQSIIFQHSEAHGLNNPKKSDPRKAVVTN